MNMARTTLSVALFLVVFASTVDCRPAAEDEPELDTSVNTAFCKVILDEGRPEQSCKEDKRYTIKSSFSNATAHAISVSFAMKAENTEEVDTSPKIASWCRVVVRYDTDIACGTLGYISWNSYSNETLKYAGTKTIQVKFRLGKTGATR